MTTTDLCILDVGVTSPGDSPVGAREGLGNEAYERAWGEGYALTLEEMLPPAAREASVEP